MKINLASGFCLERTNAAVNVLTSRATTASRLVNSEWFICKVCDGYGCISDRNSDSPKTTKVECGHCQGNGRLLLTITVQLANSKVVKHED